VQPTINPEQPSPRLLRVLSILVALAVPVLLALVSVRLVVTETYLWLEYNKPDFPPDPYGFSLADRLHYAPYAVQYLVGNAGIDTLGDLTGPDGRKLFNERELSHMVDVKTVTRVAFAVLGVTLILFALLSVALSASPEGRRALRRGLFSGGLLMLAILVSLLLAVLINWDAFFDQFHKLFFANGSWIFDYSDSLIRLFPVRFWQDAALTVGGLSGAGAILIMAGAWWWERRSAGCIWI
jgi:integral membrane protein (TIGR01906 family)